MSSIDSYIDNPNILQKVLMVIPFIIFLFSFVYICFVAESQLPLPALIP